jgi:hypothetical protein
VEEQEEISMAKVNDEGWRWSLVETGGSGVVKVKVKVKEKERNG